VKKVPLLEKVYYFLRKPFFIYRRVKIKRILRDEFVVTCPVVFFEHHLCHAASVFYSSPFEEATVVTLDSAGDGLSSRVYRVKDNEFEELHQVSAYNSPCAFYCYVTQVCGFKAGKHEGKITGLAAYGKPASLDQFKQWILHKDGTFHNIGGVFFYSGLRVLRKTLPRDSRHEDLASTIQLYSEEMAVDYVKHWLSVSNILDIALAGGIFANVRINQELHEIPGVRSIHIHLAMPDECIGLGADLAVYYQKKREKPKQICFDHIYLGPSFSDDEIRAELETADLGYENHHQNVEKEIAERLAEGYVVTRFNDPHGIWSPRIG
jgi:carbamoyltransferase